MQHDFQVFANLMTFFFKGKVIKYSLFIFIFHICVKFQTKEKKRLVTTNVFECFQLHYHILKKLLEFLHMVVAITSF